MQEHIDIERLTFVKYLLSQAANQKNLERPLCLSAILTIHDCVECFLQLCFEVKTRKSKTHSNNILDTYSEEINKILKKEDKDLINKAFIKRINDLRNQLKHATIFVDPPQIPKLHTETEVFLTDFTDTIFGMAFENISLVELISDEAIRSLLIEAEKIKNDELQEAMWSIGEAFYELEKSLTKVEGKYSEDIMRPYRDIDYSSQYRVEVGVLR